VTAAFAFNVKVQVFVLFPPLEQAPDQMTSRSFVARRVIIVPVANDADPVLPTATLMPVGVEVTRSPPRPVAVTVSVAVCGSGFTVSVAVRVTPPARAAIVTGVDAVTALVAIAKVALVAPCVTDTLAGTVAAEVVLLDRETAKPSAGAGDVSVTVPCDEDPPVTPVGFTVAVESAAAADGVTVRPAVREMPLAEAVMVVVRVVGPARVETGKVPLDSPPWTVIVAGTLAAVVFELDNETTSPPAGALPERKTVPVTGFPPSTVAGETLRDAGPTGGGCGVTVSVALRVAPPYAPLIVTDVDDVTEVVLTVNVALKAPAGTVTLAGTVAALVLLLDSVTTAPPEGAALVRLAVPCDVLPPTTLAGLSAIPASEGVWLKAPAVRRRTEDQAPAVPAELMPRTRHQYRRPWLSVPAVNCDGVTTRSRASEAEKLFESSTWMRYAVAALTSVQSKATGWAGVESCAGLRSVGAAGVGGGGAPVEFTKTGAAWSSSRSSRSTRASDSHSRSSATSTRASSPTADSQADRRAAYLSARAAIGSRALAPFSAAAWTATQLEAAGSCLEWPNDRAAARPFPRGTPLPNVPVLVLSGDLDTNTPAPSGRVAARQYPNASFVEIPNVGHTPETSPCGLALALRFVTTHAVNARACAGTGAPPPVATRAPLATAGLALPAGGGTAAQRRAIAVVVATVADLADQVDTIARWSAANGLRGGHYATSAHGGIRLDEVRVVRDAAVSGRLAQTEAGGTEGTVRLTGSGVAGGLIHVTLAANGHGRATGHLDGKTVDVRFRF